MRSALAPACRCPRPPVLLPASDRSRRPGPVTVAVLTACRCSVRDRAARRVGRAAAAGRLALSLCCRAAPVHVRHPLNSVQVQVRNRGIVGDRRPVAVLGPRCSPDRVGHRPPASRRHTVLLVIAGELGQRVAVRRRLLPRRRFAGQHRTVACLTRVPSPKLDRARGRVVTEPPPQGHRRLICRHLRRSARHPRRRRSVAVREAGTYGPVPVLPGRFRGRDRVGRAAAGGCPSPSVGLVMRVCHTTSAPMAGAVVERSIVDIGVTRERTPAEPGGWSAAVESVAEERNGPVRPASRCRFSRPGREWRIGGNAGRLVNKLVPAVVPACQTLASASVPRSRRVVQVSSSPTPPTAEA